MATKDLITLLISTTALAVAVYGIFERRRAGYAALRVRITELLEIIQQMNVDQWQYADEHPDQDWDARRNVEGAHATRRALLTYQSLELLNRIRTGQHRPASEKFRLTADEHGVLANSLMWLRDFPTARSQWEDAVTAAAHATDVQRAAMHNGYAGCLFAIGDPEAAREHYRAAISFYAESERGRYDKFCAYIDWLTAERGLRDGEWEEPLRGATELAALPSSWQEWAAVFLRDRMREAPTPA